MPVANLVADVAKQIAHAAYRDADFDSFVSSRDPECRGATAADTRHGDLVGVDVRAADQVIDRSNAVPAFDSCRCISDRLPPPAIFPVSAMMNPCDFAELQSIDDEADIAV